MNQSILVVESECVLQDLLCTALAADGYKIHRARSVLQALEAVRRQLPGAILLDTHLPGTRNALVTLRRECPTSPIVLIVDSATDADALTLGGTPIDIVEKPFDIGVIQELLRRALGATNYHPHCCVRRRAAISDELAESTRPGRWVA